MVARPSNFEAIRTAMHVLASRGITGTNVVVKLRDKHVPPDLIPTVRLVHGSNASVRKELARINQKS